MSEFRLEARGGVSENHLAFETKEYRLSLTWRHCCCGGWRHMVHAHPKYRLPDAVRVDGATPTFLSQNKHRTPPQLLGGPERMTSQQHLHLQPRPLQKHCLFLRASGTARVLGHREWWRPFGSILFAGRGLVSQVRWT